MPDHIISSNNPFASNLPRLRPITISAIQYKMRNIIFILKNYTKSVVLIVNLRLFVYV
jgi:hypothetical protein